MSDESAKAIDSGARDVVDGDDAVAAAADRLHRATIEFGLDAVQASRFEALIGAVDDVPDDLSEIVEALADAEIAEASWTRWSDMQVLGEPLDELVGRLAEIDDPSGGATWLRARHHAWFGRTDEAVELLEGARSDGDRLVLTELAAIQADRSAPVAAQRLLEQAGVDVTVDLDEVYDPMAPDADFAHELAEEIAPFAAMRPKPMAGRNDRCPCGSGKKYKQCHLGRELHPLDDRAGWLYVKMMRFLQVNRPHLPASIAAEIVAGVADPELRAMVYESHLTVDLALFEGGIAQAFLDAKRSLLPDDESELLRRWIEPVRSVFEVVQSRPGAMDVIDLSTRERLTVVETVPEVPLEAGWKLTGRLVPVGGGHRAYGGFLPVNDDMVDPLLAAFETCRLDTVSLAIAQIFDAAVTQDDVQELFEERLDTTELTALIDQMTDDIS